MRVTSELDLNGNVVSSFEIVATGTTRIIEKTGINEFSFDLSTDQTGTVFDGVEGLYFGWSTSGGAVVGHETGTAADSFVVASNGSSMTFQNGVRFSMEASFEIEAVKGITDPTALVVANDLARVYVGDKAGSVAAFEWDAALGKYIVVKADEIREFDTVGTGGSTTSNLRDDGDGEIGIAHQNDGVVVYAGETRISTSDGKLYINNNLVNLPNTLDGGRIILKGNGVVSVATNGTQIYVGVPQADYNDYRANSVIDNDDRGVVLVLDLSGQITGFLESPSSAKESNFGMGLAADGDVLAVVGRYNGLNTLAIYENGQLKKTDSLSGSSMRVDVDGDHLIVGTSAQSRIYSRQAGGNWTPVANLTGGYAVTIDGDVARVYRSGSIVSYRERGVNNWVKEHEYDTSISNRTFISTDEYDFLTYKIKINSADINVPNDSGSSAEVGFRVRINGGAWYEPIYRDGVSEDYTNFNIDMSWTFPYTGGTIEAQFREDDSTSGDEWSPVIRIATGDGLGEHREGDTGEIDAWLNYEVILVDPGENTAISSTFVDALGGLVSMASGSGVRMFSDQTYQAATYTGTSITDLVLNESGVLYVADGGAGKVYALNNLMAKLKGWVSWKAAALLLTASTMRPWPAMISPAALQTRPTPSRC